MKKNPKKPKFKKPSASQLIQMRVEMLNHRLTRLESGFEKLIRDVESMSGHQGSLGNSLVEVFVSGGLV